MAHSANYKAYIVINYFATKLCSVLEILMHPSSLMECEAYPVWGLLCVRKVVDTFQLQEIMNQAPDICN